MSYVKHPSLTKPGAEQRLFVTSVRRISADWYIRFLSGDQETVQRDVQEPWTREEEKMIFLQWNFARMKVAAGDPTWAARAQALREQITEANLGLVCSMVMKHSVVDGDRDDAISEAQAALLRAMEKFDLRKGYKFSTYACAAIFRALVRRFQRGSKRVQRFGCQHDERFDRPEPTDNMPEDLAHLWHAVGKADLTEQELDVLQMRFFDEPTLTLTECGKRLTRQDGGTSMTKERVRQIQEGALKKLRKCFEE